ncbi:MAG: ABC transporter ATP-binding protein [Planctomycetes bacterium]|nr:ABC transporter ATP-binding protein [Planctomycetota bacterium]
MSDVLLELDGVCAGYGPIEVLKGVGLRVDRGEIVTLIGANGAGKTTLLMCCSGLVRPTGGTLRFDGADIARTPAHDIVRAGLAQVPEGRRIFPRLSVLENLRLGAFTRSNQAEIAADLDKAFALFPILAERRHQAGGTLSGGEQQMLAIARALMCRPTLLLMDEPSMGVAPLLVQRIFAAITALNREGLSILLVEQNANLALATAHRGYVMETGTIALSGPTADLMHNEQVRACYLGAR